MVLLGFQSTPGLIEMKCMNGGIACGLWWMESLGRIILLGLFPLTDGLSCDKWRKTALHPQIGSVCQSCRIQMLDSQFFGELLSHEGFSVNCQIV